MMEIERSLRGYRLMTAEITYYLPDHPGALQTFVWQEFDLAPRFPALSKFLDFWSRNLDGKLHSVRVAHRDLIGAATAGFADAFMTLALTRAGSNSAQRARSLIPYRIQSLQIGDLRVAMKAPCAASSAAVGKWARGGLGATLAGAAADAAVMARKPRAACRPPISSR